MTARTAIIGLCATCALFASAIGASSAGAVSATAYTCAPTETGAQFSEAHCKTAGTGKGFKHVEIPAGKVTKISVTNEVTPGVKPVAKLKSTIAGAPILLQATGISGTGTFENSISGTEMFAHGEAQIEFTGVTNPTPGCGVVGLPGGAGTIQLKPEVATTLGQAAGRLKLEPKTSSTIAEFELTGCAIAGVYKKVGSFTGKTGATFGLGATGKVEHEDVTSQGTLRLGSVTGPKVGIEGEIVIKGENGNPLAIT
jgi:hypothetical protein